MYNNKTRQAKGVSPKETGPAGRPRVRGGGFPMLTTAVLNSILGLDIILVLVLVVLVPKENSAFGHAQNKGGCFPQNVG